MAASQRIAQGTFGASALVLAIVANSAAAADTPVQGSERFDVGEFRILGNSLLPNRAIETAVYPYLGPNRTLEDVKHAVEALEKTYKEAGYGTIYVDIPEQSVDAAIVRLQVTEGRLGQVRVTGARYVSDRRIRAALPALQPGQTPNLQTFQQQLTALNARSADMSVTPVLKPGAAPGTLDAELKVHDTVPFHGSIEANNRYSANTTPNRVAVAASYDNLWQLNHGVSLLYQWAPAAPSEAEVGAATYLVRSPSTPALWAISVIHTNSNVAAVGTLGVIGKGTIYGVHWTDPLVNTESVSHTFTFGADLKDLSQNVQLPGSSTTDSATLATPITYMNWLGQYAGAWRQASRSLAFTFSAGFGVRGLVNQPDEFAAARFDAPANYFYLRSTGQLLQTLPAGMAVLARYSGQWTDNPLLNYEQLAIGGLDTVRGYLEAEALGDSGVAGTLELHSPALGKRGGPMLGPLYALGFVDAGAVGLQQPLPGQERHTHLVSTGFGLRLENTSGLQGTLDYAWPLATGPYTERGDARFDFSIRYGF